MLETTLVQGVEPLAPAGTLFLWIYRTLSSTDDNENVLLRRVIRDECSHSWVPWLGVLQLFSIHLKNTTSSDLHFSHSLFTRPFASAAITIGAQPFLLLTVTFLSPLHPPLLAPDWPGTTTSLLSSLIIPAHKQYNLSCKEQDMSSSEWFTAATRTKIMLTEM